MKKPKTVKPYQFKDLTHQEMLDQVNKEYPVNLIYNESLIDRIYAQYPILDKTKISLIVKAVFQSWRDFLILGKVLNFNGFFFDTKLHFFERRRNGHILPALKIKITTPPPLRKYEI